MPNHPILAAGLDVGSRFTRLAVCVLEDGCIRFLAAAAAESPGWQKGRITDQRALTESILSVVRHVESSTGVSVESTVVGVGGPTVRGNNARGTYDLGFNHEIQQRDVNRVMERASRVQLQEDRMLLQFFPQDFVVDHQPGHLDPRKMLASHLEVNLYVLSASIQEHTTLVGAVNQAHVLVEETVFEGLAAAYAAVLSEDRREGVAVIDIGAHSTELVAYYGDSLHLAASLPVCGDHFTRDLAQGLRTTFEDAETVKLDFGGASSASSAGNTLVELPGGDPRKPRHAYRKFVNEILEARATELFGYVRSELERVGMDRALIGGVFLAGGGARMPDLCDIAERELQCQARYGLPLGIRDWPEWMNDPEWTTAAGLAMYSATLKEQAARLRETAGWLGKILR